MSSLWPVLVAGVWVTLLLATVIQMGRLVRRFRERYPEFAQGPIPFYFFSKGALEALRADPALWRERQRFVALVVATLGYWLAGAATICMLGMHHT